MEVKAKRKLSFLDRSPAKRQKPIVDDVSQLQKEVLLQEKQNQLKLSDVLDEASSFFRLGSSYFANLSSVAPEKEKDAVTFGPLDKWITRKVSFFGNVIRKLLILFSFIQPQQENIVEHVEVSSDDEFISPSLSFIRNMYR